MAEREWYDIRCLFIDYTRESTETGEEHWRCPMWFLFDPEAPVLTRTLCPHHQGLTPAVEAMLDAAVGAPKARAV